MLDWQDWIRLYLPLMGWVGVGLILGHKLPHTVPPRLGKFLFWIGVPVGIVIFMRQADLSASVWLAPIVCWAAVFLGAGFGWLWIRIQVRAAIAYSPHSAALPSFIVRPLQAYLTKFFSPRQLVRKPTQGSFLLAAMLGNTGYLGYPIILTLVGPQYFGWAVLYDTLGSTLAAYGLGVVLAASFGMNTQGQQPDLLQALIRNPALWSFWLGLGARTIALPHPLEQGLQGCGWGIIALSLLLLGMRLGQLTSWRSIRQACVSLGIKMMVVPILVGYGLRLIGITGAPLLVLVLQAAMPPAFATLVIAEAYDLDRDFTVTTLAIGSVMILLSLPLWLWLFAT